MTMTTHSHKHWTDKGGHVTALLTKGDIRACAASRQASSPSGPQSAGSAALTNPW